MARAHPISVAWNAGEFSPRMVARVDFQKYDNAGSLVENLLPLPQGGLTRRPGTRFVAEVKDHDTVTVLLPFQFSTDQAYILEFGDEYMRVYRNQGQVIDGGNAVEISTPYGEEDLYELKFAQSADVMWIVHPSHKPRKLTRSSHTSWTLSNYAPTSDPFTSTDDFPSDVAFFQQRIWFVASNNDPQKIWASVSGDFEDMSTGANDDDALEFVIASGESGKVNRIRWISGGRRLILGTVGGEFSVESDGPAITPNDIDIKNETSIGSADVQPIRIGNIVIFLQRARRKVHELAFRFEDDGFTAPDLTVLSDHVTIGGLIQMAYQQEPDSVLWAVRADGQLATLTYKREQDVVGWSRQILGGSFSGGDAVVESVAVIPGRDAAGQVFPSDDRDEVWLIVKRTIDGNTRRYVEFLERPFVGPRRDEYDTESAWEADMLEEQQDAFYVDCGLTYDGAATTTISGLDHLEGETVNILADGAVLPQQTVESGEIELEAEVEKAQVGLPYRWRFSPLKLPYGAQAGTAVAKVKRVHRVGMVLDSAAAFRMGADRENLKDVEFREVGDAMDTAVPLFTGERVEPFDGRYERDQRIHFEGDSPAPWTLLALAPEMQTHEAK